MYLDFFLYQAEDPLCKRNAHCIKDGSSLKIPERTKGKWLAEESCLDQKILCGMSTWACFIMTTEKKYFLPGR